MVYAPSLQEPFNGSYSPLSDLATAGKYGVSGAPVTSVDINLDPDLCNSLTRRSRWRLRDMQAQFTATLQLDRSRSVLSVCGSEAEVKAVKEHLETLWGPRKQLSAAAWAEFMRTRKAADASQSLIAKIQAASGARVHIERDMMAVRLFGSDECVAAADRLIDDVVESCVEVVSTLPSGESSMSERLQTLACECGVTFRIENGLVATLGLKHQVDTAVEHLRAYSSTCGTTSTTAESPSHGSHSGDEPSDGLPATGFSSSIAPTSMEFADRARVEDASSQNGGPLPRAPRFCSYCGVQRGNGGRARFCVECGNKYPDVPTLPDEGGARHASACGADGLAASKVWANGGCQPLARPQLASDMVPMYEQAPTHAEMPVAWMTGLYTRHATELHYVDNMQQETCVNTRRPYVQQAWVSLTATD